MKLIATYHQYFLEKTQLYLSKNLDNQKPILPRRSIWKNHSIIPMKNLFWAMVEQKNITTLDLKLYKQKHFVAQEMVNASNSTDNNL